MKTVKFNEAFKKQLSMAKPLTESTIRKMHMRECYLTKEKFLPGETPLFVFIPEGSEMVLVGAKREALEKSGWRYVDNGTPVPRVAG